MDRFVHPFSQIHKRRYFISLDCFSLVIMAQKSPVLFLIGALTLQLPYSNAAWVLSLSNQTDLCINDMFISGSDNTPCLKLPFEPQAFFLSGVSNDILMCLEDGCENCQLLGSGECHSLRENGIRGTTFQVI
jgi:hypothetical protein